MNALRVRHLENALYHCDALSGGRFGPFLVSNGNVVDDATSASASPPRKNLGTSDATINGGVKKPGEEASGTGGQPIDLFLKRYFRAHRSLGSADRAWISDSFYEVVRWKGLLHHVSPPPRTWSSILRTYFASNRWKAHSQNKRLPAHIRCSFPPDLFARICDSVGGEEKGERVCQILNERAPVFLRVNVSKISRDMLARFLQNKGVTVEKCTHSPMGLILNEKQRLLDLPEYRTGLMEIQDEASQLVSFKVQAAPGEQIMDYCAGSGGKTLAFSPQMENSGKIYLHDVRDRKLSEAKARLRRAGISNYTLVRQNHPIIPKLVGKMDWVVTDVPCTGTGALRRNPDMKWQYSDSRLHELVGLQRSIFGDALRYLKPSTGKIVYITCSILQEENSEQVRFLCNRHGLRLEEKPFHALPQSNGMDGFFCAVMSADR